MDRRSSGDQVANYIQRLIFEGRLRHGDHIRQDEIADELGVSRIPVREAIIALDRDGWVTIEPHRGAFVHGLDENAVRDQYALLGLLCGLTARRAVERGGADALAALCESRQRLAVAENPADVWQANEDFMRRMFSMASSPRLASFSRLLDGVIPGNCFEVVSGAIEVQKKGIAAIADAIADRDADKAFDECVALLRRQGERVNLLLKSREVSRR